MNIKAWMMHSWPDVAWYMPMEPDHWPKFSHADTRVREGIEHGSLRHGDTVWTGGIGGSRVGVAWEWVELRQGVVVLADPNSIQANIRFVTENNVDLEDLVSLICLNRLPHHLRWQPYVNAALASLDGPPKTIAVDINLPQRTFQFNKVRENARHAA